MLHGYRICLPFNVDIFVICRNSKATTPSAITNYYNMSHTHLWNKTDRQYATPHIANGIHLCVCQLRHCGEVACCSFTFVLESKRRD